MSERAAVRKLRDHQGPSQGTSKGPARNEMPSGSCRAAELQRDGQNECDGGNEGEGA